MLSPWHFIGFGLIALLGTGILAALERSHERAASSQSEAVSHKTVLAQTVKPAAMETAQAPLVQAPHTSVSVPSPIGPMAAQAATPAIGASRDGASVTPRALELPRPAATAAAPVQAVLPTSREASAPEGPAVTASLSPAAPPSRPAASPAPQSSIGGAVKTDAAAATDCLPEPLRTVLADVAARFGGVAVVSTHKLNTTNHSAGSIRATLHHDCKAVDIRPDRTRIEEIKTYLRTRREVNGIESYRNGIIHIDVSGTAIAASRPRGRQARTQASAETGAVDAVQAAPPQPAAAPLAAAPPSPFTPVVPERYR